MDDVVQRLRAGLEAGAIDLADIMDAADEIERLRHGTAVSENCVAGNHPEIPCPTNHDAAPAAKANAESVVPQPTAGDRSGNPTSQSGTGDSFSSAEIDALQHVVEDGRIVKMQDYGALRSLLVRLRPEWDGEGDSDRPKPINDERMAGELSRSPDRPRSPTRSGRRWTWQ